MKNREDSSPAPHGEHGAKVNKKGLGAWHADTSAEELRALHLSWYYNWRPFAKIAPVAGVEYVPMFWNADDVIEENLQKVAASKPAHVLGFNEPDLEGQSNMTPEVCLDLWPKLMELNVPLGSPAPASYKWLEKFMPEAQKRGLRVDFVCLHRYPDISNPVAVDEIKNMIEEVRERYKLPIWLTESGAADVTAWKQPQMATPTPEMAESFIKRLVAMLEAIPYVERYAWFADRVTNEYKLGSIFDPYAQGLTAIGEIYRDAV